VLVALDYLQFISAGFQGGSNGQLSEMENKRDVSVEESAAHAAQKDGDEETAKRSEVHNLKSCAIPHCEHHTLSQLVSFLFQ